MQGGRQRITVNLQPQLLAPLKEAELRRGGHGSLQISKLPRLKLLEGIKLSLLVLQGVVVQRG